MIRRRTSPFRTHPQRRRKEAARVKQRQLLLETLEVRHLLTAARLIGVQPSDGQLLDLNGVTELNEGLRDLTFRFDRSRVFDTRILEGIRITRTGDDGLLATADDLRLRPGFIGPNPARNQNEIVFRFRDNPPDDAYRIEVFGADDPASGIIGLRNIQGEFVDHFQIDFAYPQGANSLAQLTATAINGAGLGFSAVASDGRVHLGSRFFRTLDTTAAPSLLSGGQAGTVQDGATFEVATPAGAVVFEFDEDTINVRGVNDALTAEFAGDDVDSDDDRATLFYNELTQPTEGGFVSNGDGTITFDPLDDFADLAHGEPRMAIALYASRDRQGATSATSELSAEGFGDNDPPTANDDPGEAGGYSTSEDAPFTVGNRAFGVLGNDTDPDGDVLFIENAPLSITTTRGASVVLNADGTFTYDPRMAAELQAMIVGETLLDTFQYTASDGKGGSDTAEATMTVTGRNDAPIARDVTIQAREDGPIVTGAFDGDDADSDDDPSTLTYTIVPGSGPVEGQVLNKFDGAFFFIPSGYFQDLREGEVREVAFQYQAADSHDTVGPAGTVTIQVAGRNDAPAAVNDLGTVNNFNSSVEIPILANDVDPDGSPLDAGSVLITRQPNHGALNVNPSTGVVTYTSNTGFTGNDSFAYTVADDEGPASLRSNEAIVSVTTTEFPIAVDDAAATLEEAPVRIPVLANDKDPDGSLDPSSVSIFSDPANGVVQVNSDGAVTYTPNPGFLGEDSFRYTVRDDVGATSNAATVTIDVTVNSTPFRNPRNRLDVNDDGFITPFDVLLIVSHLNRVGNQLPTTGPPPYLDTSIVDNLITPRDALAVLVHLQTNGSGPAGGEPEGEGEGEADAGWPSLLVAPSSTRSGASEAVRPAELETLPAVEPQPATAAAGWRRDSGRNALMRLTGADRSELEEIADQLGAAAISAGTGDLIDQALLQLLG